MPQLILQGSSLAYSDHGQGEAVVLIHGLGSRGRDFLPQIELLSSRFRVIAPDLRGHGQSSQSRGPFSMRDLAGDVAAILAKTRVGPSHVVGLSLGGMVAFELAVDFPEHVRSLTIVNSGPEVIPKNVAQWLAVETRVLSARYLPMRTLGRRIGARLFPHPSQQGLFARFVHDFSKIDRSAYLAALSAIVGWTVLDRIGDISVPTLVVTGDRDYTSVVVKERYAARMQNARVTVIAESGHATPIDQPDRFNAVLLGFLESLSPRESTPPAEPTLEVAS